MFSYHTGLRTYIVASRTISVLIRNASQLNLIETDLHKNIAKLWFKVIEQLDKDQEKELQRELEEHTWVGEYLNTENLIDYSQD
jgi:hypothetical protein